MGGFEEQCDILVIISYLYVCYFCLSEGGAHGSVSV